MSIKLKKKLKKNTRARDVASRAPPAAARLCWLSWAVVGLRWLSLALAFVGTSVSSVNKIEKETKKKIPGRETSRLEPPLLLVGMPYPRLADLLFPRLVPTSYSSYSACISTLICYFTRV